MTPNVVTAEEARASGIPADRLILAPDGMVIVLPDPYETEAPT